MSRENDYFYAERYRGLAELDRLPTEMAGAVRQAIEALRAASDHPRASPDAFSQELLFATDPGALEAYLAREEWFPFYRRSGAEGFWRSLRQEAPWLERLAETFPLLDPSFFEQLWLERGRGLTRAMPSPGEARGKWRAVPGFTVDFLAGAAAAGPYGAAFVTPRFGVGGSEKVIRALSDAILALTGLPSLVIVADAAAGDLPAGAVGLADLTLWGEPFLRAPLEARVNALHDLILRTGAPRVFSVNSALGTALLEIGLLREAGVATAAAIFLAGVGPGGSARGYIHNADWLIDAGVTLFTDNRFMAGELARWCAWDGTVVLDIPAPISASTPPEGERVLWAGRIDAQKRPELLVETARLAPGLTFEAWGAPLMSGQSAMEEILAQPNIVYRGAFDGFAAIDLTRIGAMLYTSAFDGTPNILLEAMGAGLSCVASAVGGVPDLLAENRGRLVPGEAPAAAYAEAIRDLMVDPHDRRDMGEAARVWVAAHHSHQAFQAGVERLMAAMQARLGA